MSDTTNRGRVLFVLMTNRPDKLDIDIKRAGRLDRKIPFFYGQDADEIEPILKAQLRRHKVDHALEWPRDRAETSEKLVGYSNADIEAVVLLANDPGPEPRQPRHHRDLRAGGARLPALARHGHAGVHGAAGRVRGLEPRHAAPSATPTSRPRSCRAGSRRSSRASAEGRGSRCSRPASGRRSPTPRPSDGGRPPTVHAHDVTRPLSERPSGVGRRQGRPGGRLGSVTWPL
jgi:hypothetical protein